MGCDDITDEAVVAVASGCKQLTKLSWCRNITDAARVLAVASGCKQLTTLDLACCGNITDAAVVAVASGCKQLTTLNLHYCSKITDVAVVAVASGCKQLTTLDLYRCHKITDAAVVAVASGCKQLTSDAQAVLVPQHNRRGGAGVGLGVQAARVAQPAMLRVHHRRGES